MTSEGREKALENIRHNIATYGQHLYRVGPTKNDPPDTIAFSYTIGNHQCGLPELLITGPVGFEWSHLLNHLGTHQRERGKGFEHGELVELKPGYSVKIVDAGEKGKAEFALGAGDYYDTDDFTVMQVLIPDESGRYPDDAVSDDAFFVQPIVSRL
jgi:hypothetical protein